MRWDFNLSNLTCGIFCSKAVPSIGRQFPSLPSYVLFDLGFDHNELLRVRDVVGKPLSHNRLVIDIHDDLSVVTLNKSVVGFHDPAFPNP